MSYWSRYKPGTTRMDKRGAAYVKPIDWADIPVPAGITGRQYVAAYKRGFCDKRAGMEKSQNPYCDTEDTSTCRLAMAARWLDGWLYGPEPVESAGRLLNPAFTERLNDGLRDDKYTDADKART